MRRFTAALMILACVVLVPRANADQAIYDDSLRNGWQNWSWCTVDLGSTDYFRGGAKSAKITYTGGWQGFYLHHGAFDTTLYTSLRFWIHGGGVNGRNITIAALRGDTAQPAVDLNPYISGGSVSGSQWREVVIPLFVLKVFKKPDMTGFWLQESSGGAQPAFYVDDISLVAASPPNPINISVNADSALRKVDSRIFGLNTAVWDGALNTTGTTTLLKAAALRILRFPGGSLSDDYHWKTNTTGNNSWQWVSSFDAFSNAAKSSAAEAFITVNYGTGTAQEAADWVAYANKTKALGIKYWEIGNECYGPWEPDNQPIPHDPYTYAVRAKEYIDRMKAVDPSIKVGVVAVTGEDSYVNNTNHAAVNPRTGATHYGWTPVMLSTLKSLGVTPDFLIYHRYEQAPWGESDETLLQSSKSWKTDAADLRQQLSDYLGASGAGVELVCTENNSIYSNPGKQTTSLVNGLFLLDSVGSILQTEFNAMTWWDLRNGQETGNNLDAALYGWRQYGDYGIMSDQNDTYPTYHTLKLLSKFAKDGDSIVQASTDFPLLACYAARRADGSLALLVINKSPTATINGAVAVAGFTPKSGYKVWSYGIPQDEAARTGVGSRDIVQTSVAGASASFTRAFPPYSASVLILSPAVAPQSLTPVKDAYVRAGAYANTNYGTAQSLVVRRSGNNPTNGQNRCAYLTFDLTGVTSNPKSALLNLTPSGSVPLTSSSPLKVYYLTDNSWTETAVTWNNAPGLDRNNFSSTGALVTSRRIPLGAPLYTLDLTAFVAANKGKIVTLQVLCDALDNNTVGFKSCEASSGKPTLVLSF